MCVDLFQPSSGFGTKNRAFIESVPVHQSILLFPHTPTRNQDADEVIRLIRLLQSICVFTKCVQGTTQSSEEEDSYHISL